MKRNNSIAAALIAALLFGISTPLAKVLVSEVPPIALAGLFYLGSGIGLLAWRWLRQCVGAGVNSGEAPLIRSDWRWLAGAILAGGVVAPTLLMLGIARTDGSTAALLLNFEGVFSALLAWFVFHENVDRRIAVGFFLIAGAGVLLSWAGTPTGGSPIGTLVVIAACLGWAVDNNLTQHISGSDPTQIAGIKGLVAGCINLGLAWFGGWHPAPPPVLFVALGVGFLGYGVSLTLFVSALRSLGTARTGAYFSVAPFFGAATALIILSERPGGLFWAAAAMMAIGVWLHVTERHVHLHDHQRLIHAHAHRHDEHHQHEHDDTWNGAEPHSHLHEHVPLAHSHPHYPDLHHRHRH
ncbi:MAG: EamA family transporter [Chromatiales bacterium 21-64-14]|nr:MAG: EamA family transporter [Chromatiales bacterium 21-64-14]HQU16682.1 DMT family transporter [Gammaproteobacteria bacterium]